MWLEERANTSTSQSAYLCVVGNVGETWLYGDNGWSENFLHGY